MSDERPTDELCQLSELCRRLRRMVETQGHYIDFAYDRTLYVSRAHDKRWIWSGLHAIVNLKSNELRVVHWSANEVLLRQTCGNHFLKYPLAEVTQDLLTKLRVEMLLEELADV